MVYDSIRQRLVLFGGYSQGNLDDTWEWDGSSWSQRTTATAPPGRSLFSMAFDRERGVTVLFGGYGSTPFLGDLWEWDGVSWVERTPTTGPEARRSAAMAFDPIRRDIVMYGGLRTQNGNDIPSLETWSWDGSSWLRQTPLTPPPYLTQARAVADLRRHRVVLHGGEFGYFTWEWDGQQWRVPSQSSPAPRVDHGMAYDPVGRRIVLFGGQLLGAAVADTWVFQTPHPADAVPYGNGCAGTSGVPELGNRGDSWPWIGDTYQQRVANLAPTSGGAFFVTGFTAPSPISLTPFGMPGCSQLVTPAIVEPRAAVGGESVWSLAIPNSVAFANVQLFQQAIALDGGANIAGLTVSNGVELTIGIR